MIRDVLADVLIPAHEKMPSASEAGAHAEWLDRVLSVRPDLVSELERILGSISEEEPRNAVALLQDERPDDLEILFTALAGAYFMSDLVRERLGYAGQRALEVSEAERPAEEELVRPVVARGPIYRRVS